MLKKVKTEMYKYRNYIAAIQEIRWRGSDVLDTGHFILMYSVNESNTFETGFLINRKYKQAIMNSEEVDEIIYSVRMREKFNNFTIISVPTSTE
jgi:hypothetical protein